MSNSTVFSLAMSTAKSSVDERKSVLRFFRTQVKPVLKPFEGQFTSVLIDYHIEIFMAFDKSMLAKIRRALGNAYEKRYSHVNDSGMSYSLRHRETGQFIRIFMSVLSEGSTCKRVKTGEKVETYTRDIFEIVCD